MADLRTPEQKAALEMRRCFNCRWFYSQDQGYSNWTVTDTEVDCLKELNPNFPVPESYSWKYEEAGTRDHPTFMVAETCAAFEFPHLAEDGSRIQLGVYVEGLEKSDLELYAGDPELLAKAQEFVW